MVKYLNIFVLLLCAGCSVTYTPPVGVSLVASGEANASKKSIFNTAMAVLNSQGFRIAHHDRELGIIQTEPKSMRITPNDADCGKTLGLDYLKDNRTKTQISYNISANDGSITIRVNIDGEYKPGAVDQDITLTCISRGTLEQHLLDEIRNQIHNTK